MPFPRALSLSSVLLAGATATFAADGPSGSAAPRRSAGVAPISTTETGGGLRLVTQFDDDYFDSKLLPVEGVAPPSAPPMITATASRIEAPCVAPTCAPPAPGYSPQCSPSAPFSQSTEPWLNPSAPAASDSFAGAADPALLARQERVAAYMGEAGYIDLAMPFNNVRLRYDAAYDSNFMTRAEFTNATCGTPGAPLPETNYDAQYIALYGETLVTERFSVFGELPFLMLDPTVNQNAQGLYDINVGGKYALVAQPDEYFTFQFRVYVPTGDEGQGLSTGHVSLEPVFLYTRRLTERLTLLGELRYWIPIDGSTQLGNQDAAGNVLRYGVGLGYAVVDNADVRVTPIAELVGWHVFDGLKFNANTGFLPADNDAIVNFKIGVRVTNFDGSIGDSHSLYVGYGTALTDERWYQDLFRAEYRITF